MPWGLRRFQQAKQLHFPTFSYYRRQPLLTATVRTQFERSLERMRLVYGFVVVGYVVCRSTFICSSANRSTESWGR